jgi:NADH-quinone oxidoreductase subunit N
MNLVSALAPELILIIAAGVLFLLGMSNKPGARKLAPILALISLVWVFLMQLRGTPDNGAAADIPGMFRTTQMSTYIQMLASGVGALFVLLSWPTDPEATGNSALNFNTECSEYFGLMLLAISGIFLVAGADDLILLFLGIELASIPTYIMVSISRPIPAAQEAGVKYFFLGAMAAAIMLFGFSYLYGTTGTTTISQITAILHGTQKTLLSPVNLTPWQTMAVVMIISGFAFKLAAVPLHFYAGDVYQGAATPVTALLSFVPKTAGMVALLKILYCVGGGQWAVPPQIAKLIWVLAVLTMTVGNVLGLLQLNIKRVLAYSSIAHSGYMLVGVAALCYALADPDPAEQMSVQQEALQGVLFYLAAYGIMNAAAFGVLMLLPSRDNKPATSAETFEDIAGAGRKHVALGLAMAVACFSLIGLPLTVGFFGKYYLISPALRGHNYWLVALTMMNAAISAGYYLRIVGAMFLRTEPAPRALATNVAPAEIHSLPVTMAISLSVAGTLLFGTILPATQRLSNQVPQVEEDRAEIQSPQAPRLANSQITTSQLTNKLQ